MSSSPLHQHLTYRPEIDGLRAVAVLPVVFYHAGFAGFSGGFIGVDIFFVISGFLITSIILEQQAKGTFQLLSFYERRARRLLPALFLVMASTLPAAWIVLRPTAMEDFCASLLAVLFFSSNILFAQQNDYFAPAAEEIPWLHSWSLAVEEQYYIVFPLLLMLLWRYRSRYIPHAIVLGIVLSFGLSEWGWRNFPEVHFYLAPTRAWELLSGAGVAFFLGKKPSLKIFSPCIFSPSWGLVFFCLALLPSIMGCRHPVFTQFCPSLAPC
ncbi:MAG: acyltransferase [Alphaproteobacteria bacterium]|nr:acyltransferase [Alphaproteobacteria bacterium]